MPSMEAVRDSAKASRALGRSPGGVLRLLGLRSVGGPLPPLVLVPLFQAALLALQIALVSPLFMLLGRRGCLGSGTLLLLFAVRLLHSPVRHAPVQGLPSPLPPLLLLLLYTLLLLVQGGSPVSFSLPHRLPLRVPVLELGPHHCLLLIRLGSLHLCLNPGLGLFAALAQQLLPGGLGEARELHWRQGLVCGPKVGGAVHQRGPHRPLVAPLRPHFQGALGEGLLWVGRRPGPVGPEVRPRPLAFRGPARWPLRLQILGSAWARGVRSGPPRGARRLLWGSHRLEESRRLGCLGCRPIGNRGLRVRTAWLPVPGRLVLSGRLLDSCLLPG
mmetsp:Transcript_90439/g.264655  ORF Transcript_90439/g.264655 Transcript_90439/m.264655 type:complete len:330 (-) Transcript_90439:963-1952(-)